MESKGLIFIPDISGFTRFVNETELEHSRLIIEELLESIINSNNLDLQISEIEGDAVLFYKFGEAPTMQQLFGQVQKMFCEFHRHIRNYEYRRLCQCLACTKAIDLSLKVIVHYGEFSSYKVREFSKLLGKDIILAHQLLKNDIDQHEYMLVTDRIPTQEELNQLPEWVHWNAGTKSTENGEVAYNYSMLTPLKQQIPPDPLPDLELKNKKLMFTVTRDYDVPTIELLSVIGDFSRRSKWVVGLKEIEEVSDKLPQIGTRHRCVLDNRSVIIYTSSYSYTPDKIIMAETDEKKMHSMYYTVEKIGEGKTRFSTSIYLKKNPFLQLMFNLAMKKKMIRDFEQSMVNLEEYLKTVPVNRWEHLSVGLTE